MAGLRRTKSTIALERVSIGRRRDPDRGDRTFPAETHESEGDVIVDPELMELFRGYYARRNSDFVIESAASLILAYFSITIDAMLTSRL